MHHHGHLWTTELKEGGQEAGWTASSQVGDDGVAWRGVVCQRRGEKALVVGHDRTEQQQRQDKLTRTGQD